jgi:predicted transcriptional regulator
MAEEERTQLLREINDNLKVLRKLIEIQLRGPVKDELSGLASSNERRKMWILSDGTLGTTDISKKAGVSRRAVQYFVQDGLKLGFVRVDKRGYPSRTIDWVPPEWEKLLGQREGKQPGESV